MQLFPPFRFGNASFSTWVMFSCYARSPLVRISGTINQFKYSEILMQYVFPLRNKPQAANLRILYQHDVCGPHHAESVPSFINLNDINTILWPGQGSDLDPIENLWEIMKQRLHIQTHHPNAAGELYEQLRQTWNSLPDKYFKKTVSLYDISL